MRLKPFNPEARCPKCGHDTVKTRYCRGGPDSDYRDLCWDKGLNREHLHRNCERCHYEWEEACINKASLLEEVEP